MNYYPFHLGDYAAHTAHLEPMEDLAYRRMLDAYYLREAPLPADIAEVARIVRLRKHVAEVEVVLREFFTLSEDGWRHQRCDEEIDRMRDKQAKARASAAASVNARRAKAAPQPSERSADVELPTPTPTPTPTPGGKERGPRSPNGSRIPDDFPGDAEIEHCRQARPDLDPALIAQQFRDHWVAKPGKDGRKLDWSATWRLWVSREQTRLPFGRASPLRRETTDEHNRRAFEEAKRLIANEARTIDA